MIDYLKNYGLSDLDINNIKNNIDKELIYDLEIMKSAVMENLDYLKSIGVTNFNELLSKRIDICFINLEYLTEITEKYGKDLISFTINNALDSLSQFEI